MSCAVHLLSIARRRGCVAEVDWKVPDRVALADEQLGTRPPETWYTAVKSVWNSPTHR
jgi:hypothetical protein